MVEDNLLVRLLWEATIAGNGGCSIVAPMPGALQLLLEFGDTGSNSGSDDDPVSSRRTET